MKGDDIVGKIIFRKLLALMEEKNLTTYKIRQNKIISERTLQHIRKDEPISTDSIRKMCEVLNCQPGDILEYVEDETEE